MLRWPWGLEAAAAGALLRAGRQLTGSSRWTRGGGLRRWRGVRFLAHGSLAWPVQMWGRGSRGLCPPQEGKAGAPVAPGPGAQALLQVFISEESPT